MATNLSARRHLRRRLERLRRTEAMLSVPKLTNAAPSGQSPWRLRMPADRDSQLLVFGALGHILLDAGLVGVETVAISSIEPRVSVTLFSIRNWTRAKARRGRSQRRRGCRCWRRHAARPAQPAMSWPRPQIASSAPPRRTIRDRGRIAIVLPAQLIGDAAIGPNHSISNRCRRSSKS